MRPARCPVDRMSLDPTLLVRRWPERRPVVLAAAGSAGSPSSSRCRRRATPRSAPSRRCRSCWPRSSSGSPAGWRRRPRPRALIGRERRGRAGRRVPRRRRRSPAGSATACGARTCGNSACSTRRSPWGRSRARELPSSDRRRGPADPARHRRRGPARRRALGSRGADGRRASGDRDRRPERAPRGDRGRPPRAARARRIAVRSSCSPSKPDWRRTTCSCSRESACSGARDRAAAGTRRAARAALRARPAARRSGGRPPAHRGDAAEELAQVARGGAARPADAAPRGPRRARGSLDELHAQIVGVLEDMRELAGELRPYLAGPARPRARAPGARPRRR